MNHLSQRMLTSQVGPSIVGLPMVAGGFAYGMTGKFACR